MQKWEYRTLTRSGMIGDLELNQLGQQGWSLVTCFVQDGQTICIFCRPVAQADETP